MITVSAPTEAPPAIISMFLGEQLEDVIDQLCSTGEATHSKQGGTFKTGVDSLPDFAKDATDSNRTSPFAFTGNKFEFRMVGSSDSDRQPQRGAKHHCGGSVQARRRMSWRRPRTSTWLSMI